MLTSRAVRPAAAAAATAATRRITPSPRRGFALLSISSSPPGSGPEQSGMPHVRVAAQAGHVLPGTVRPLDGRRDRRVALAAGLLRDLAVALGDQDRLVEPAGRECIGVVVAVQRLGGVLGDQPRRRVA